MALENLYNFLDLSITGIKVSQRFLLHAYPHTNLEFTYTVFKDMARNY